MFRIVVATILSFHAIQLLTACTAAGHPTISEPPMAEEGVQQKSAYAPYWYVDDQTDSSIEVKNLLDSPLTLLPKLTTISGQSLQLKPLTVAPRSTERLNLKPYVQVNSQGRRKSLGGKPIDRWGDGSRPNSQLGSAALMATSPRDSDAQSFSAWIVVKNRKEGLGVVSPFHQAHADEIDTVLEGLWWLPYRDTQAYFALQNTSRQQIDLYMELYSNGQAIKSKRIQLEAFAFKFVNIGEVLGVAAPPEIGGVRFSYKSQLRQHVMARGLLVEDKTGFCSPLNLYESVRDVTTEGRSELQAPVAYFGKLGKLVSGSMENLNPHLLLRNTAKREITVQGTIYGKDLDGRYIAFQLQSVTLKPEWPIAINLERERQTSQSNLADGIAGLRLTHDGDPTDIVAELINVSETGNLAFYDRMRNLFFHKAATQIAISFNLESGHQSFLILKNTTSRFQRLRILLDYTGGNSPYDLLIPNVPPQQVEIIDIKHLRDSGVPDQQGQTLPHNVSFGGARILSERGAFVSSDPTFVFSLFPLSATGIAWSCASILLDGGDPPPPQPPPMVNCACYYGYDEECKKDFVCDKNWMPINCKRRKPKGGTLAGKCTEKDEQKIVRPCDANCSEKSTKSVCADQDTAAIARALEIWLQAMTLPAERGGGPIDRELVIRARSTPLSSACNEYLGWRTLAVLELCRGHEIVDHSEDHDTLEDHVLANLSGDTCRIEAGNACIRSIAVGVVNGPAAIESELASIASVCPQGLPFASPGPGYERVPPLEAIRDRLQTTVERLRGSTQ